MKILHIAPTPFFSNRGCHIRIENIMCISESFAKCSVCTYHHGDDIQNREIHRIWTIPGYHRRTAGFSIYKILADVFLLLLVLGKTLKGSPHLLHGHLHEGALIAWTVRTLLFWRHLPVVMDMQGSLSRELVTYKTFGEQSIWIRFFRTVESWICRLPDHFICSSDESRRILIEDFGVKQEKVTLLMDTVPKGFMNGFDRETCRKLLGFSKDNLLILYTGSLLPGKGLEIILEMMPAVIQQYPQIKFCLVGYPVKETRRHVLELGVENAVLLPGEVPYFQLPKFLAAADIALEPKMGSSGEASGKLMHYMVALLPVVCFKTPNNVQLLGEDAVYASEETGEAFKEALCHIIESEALRTRLQLQMRTRSYPIKEEASHAKVLAAVYAPMIPKGVMA